MTSRERDQADDGGDEHTWFTGAQLGLLASVVAPAESSSPSWPLLLARPRQRFAVMLEESLTADDVAALLGAPLDRVHGRVTERTLYAVETRSGFLFPRMQFTETGVLPGWEVVAPTIPVRVHPVDVQGALLATVADFELGGAPVSAREWLSVGGDPVRVVDFLDESFDLRFPISAW